MSWTVIHSGVSADGEHEFTVERLHTLILVPAGGRHVFLARRRWRVRVRRSGHETWLAETTVRRIADAKGLLARYSIEWTPPPDAARRRVVPGL